MAEDNQISQCPFKIMKRNEGDNVHSNFITEDDRHRSIEEKLREFQVLDEIDEDDSDNGSEDGDGKLYTVW